MRHALAVVAVLAMLTVPGGTRSSVTAARPDGGLGASPAASGAPASRLVIVIPDPAGAPGAPGSVDLSTPLRLADPAATVMVLPTVAEARTAGPFRVMVESTFAPVPGAVLRVMTDAAATFSVEVTTAGSVDGQVTVVEVLGGSDGVTAWRIGDLVPSPDELRLPTWRMPGPGVDAVALEGAWWSVVPGTQAPGPTLSAPAIRSVRDRVTRSPVSRLERLVDASIGDVTGDGVEDVALSFRRPFQRTLLNVSRPRRFWVDPAGRSAHVGLFRPGDLSSIWVAGTLVRPVHRLAACTGALAVTYSTLRRTRIVAASAWMWQGFGFLPLPELPGRGRPSCIDIDRDGRPDAAIIERG